jgi:quercetin dioxygenase-like cupin family protein
MLPFSKIDIEFDVDALREVLEESDLFGELPQRGLKGSPHENMKDIWVRYKDPSEALRTGDWSGLANEHKSEWLKDIPYVKEICEELMTHLEGQELGGVLITKLPAGEVIYPHTDSGWHASYYDKYFLAIKNDEGAEFCFEEGNIVSKPGEVYAFRNDVLHWVVNNSDKDRIAMIVCIKQNKRSKEGLCLGQQFTQ